jgi:hypothetical protein
LLRGKHYVERHRKIVLDSWRFCPIAAGALAGTVPVSVAPYFWVFFWQSGDRLLIH